MMPRRHGEGVRCGRRLVLAMALVLWVPAAASAAGSGGAEGYVGELAQEAIALSRSGPDGQAGRLEQLLDRSTDIPLVGRLVLGRYWRTASAEQRKDYLELFRGYVLAGITRRLGGSNGVEKVEVTGSRPGRGQDSMVATLVTLGNGAAPSPIEWRVRRTGDGYRIIDAAVEGVSLVVTNRNEFGAIVAKSGLDGLLQQLREWREQPAAQRPTA